MNRLLHILLLFLLGVEINATASGSFVLDPPNMPESSFENASGGIAIALALKSRVEKGTTIHFIQVYVRNTSNADRYLFPHPTASRFEIHYVNDQGVQVPLRNYQYSGDINSNSGPVVIKPGHTLTRDIVLKGDEWTIVHSHSIIFSCNVFGAGSSLIKVVSSPKLIGESGN